MPSGCASSIPADNVVLPEIISKEPLAPSVRQGDDQWYGVMTYTVFAMLNAEELGVTSKNVDDMKKSDNPSIRRLLGVEGDQGKGFGLANDWAYNVIKQVGNYGEVFDRNVGDGSPLKIKRGAQRAVDQGRPAVRHADPLTIRAWPALAEPGPSEPRSLDRPMRGAEHR